MKQRPLLRVKIFAGTPSCGVPVDQSNLSGDALNLGEVRPQQSSKNIRNILRTFSSGKEFPFKSGSKLLGTFFLQVLFIDLGVAIRCLPEGTSGESPGTHPVVQGAFRKIV